MPWRHHDFFVSGKIRQMDVNSASSIRKTRLEKISVTTSMLELGATVPGKRKLKKKTVAEDGVDAE